MPRKVPIIPLLVCTLLGGLARAAPQPVVPGPADVTRYDRLQPVFRNKTLSKADGDALLAALVGGKVLQPWMKDGFPPGIICALPAPEHLWLNLIRPEADAYPLGFSFDGGLAYLPDGWYEVDESARVKIAAILVRLEANLKKEIIAAPRPCTYTIGTVDDGGTLSGIAHMFYGSSAKWKQIYSANRAAIRNPNAIRSGMTLTIPSLKK